jgi:hypothetical protein
MKTIMKIKKQIDTGKLKVKYVLGIHTTLPSYPDAEDILYELIRDYCGKVAKEIKFTDVSLIKKYNISDEKGKNIIQYLCEHAFLEEVNVNPNYITYEVIYNPYE